MTRAIGSSADAGMIRMAGTNAGAAVPEGAGLAAERQRLQEVCAEFEAFFLREVLKGLRATTGPGAGMLAGGPAGADVQAGLADDQFSVWLAKSGGMGLGKALYESLVKQLGDDAANPGD
ncbi:MAG: hypothetical protein ACM3X4_06195 [Ignavibacteriales bacterium]